MQETRKRQQTGVGTAVFILGLLIFIGACFTARWTGVVAAYASFVGILLVMMALSFG